MSSQPVAPFTLRLGASFGHAAVVGLPIAPLMGASRETWTTPLHPAERAMAARWADRRVRTFAAGRAALRAALRELGADVEGPILATPRGAPLLPPHLRGSISHKDEVAVALAAHARDVNVYLGVDVELVDARRSDVSRLVLTERERAELETLAALDRPAHARAVLLRFSLKEALYKALDPYVQRWVGFHEVEVRPHHDGSAPFTLHLPASEGPFAAEGTWTARGDTILTAAWVARPQADTG